MRKAFFAEVKPFSESDAQITPIFKNACQAIEYAEGLLRCARMDMQDGKTEVLGPVLVCVLTPKE